MGENNFEKYKERIIGDGVYPKCNNYGKKILYADWAASGRLYLDIENQIIEGYGPYYSNTHSHGNYISNEMEELYVLAENKILNHFGGVDNYEVIASGFGMTYAINKLQDILASSGDYQVRDTVVLLSKYEHNSNFITWKERGYKCIILDHDNEGQIDLDKLKSFLEHLKRKTRIIASLSACSNVTGIILELREVIKLLKKYNSLICIDYTTIAPYDKINIEDEHIDVLIFSAHKFLGGVGGPGVLLISKDIYKLSRPSTVGGGTVDWVNPFGEILYKGKISRREEAGTPPILQMAKLALAIDLKDNMGVENVKMREQYLSQYMLGKLSEVKSIVIYDEHIQHRLPIISFNFLRIGYARAIRMLDEIYGIQARGGCSCASIYGHDLLNITKEDSDNIYRHMKNGDVINNYGWVRISLSPVVSNNEVEYICNAIKNIGDEEVD